MKKRKVKRKNFTFCRADISDQYGEFLANVKIWEHDAKEGFIEVQPSPALTSGILCNVVIRTTPKPWTYKGRIHEVHGRTIILIINEDGTESRYSLRYKANMKARIEGLICEETVYPLHTDIEVEVENISRGGLRLHTRKNTFCIGDKLLARLDNNWPGENPLLILEIINDKEISPEYLTYGCRFVFNDEIKLKPAVGSTNFKKSSTKTQLIINALETGL